MSIQGQWMDLLASMQMPEDEQDRFPRGDQQGEDGHGNDLPDPKGGEGTGHGATAAANNLQWQSRLGAQSRPLPTQENDDDGDELDSDEEPESAKKHELNERALANVKPFLQALFDDGPLQQNEELDPLAANQDGRQRGLQKVADVVSRQVVPDGSYKETLKREMAKPQILNYCPSTDRAPLVTRTAPPTFTTFKAPANTPECSFSMYGVSVNSTARFRRENNDVTGFPTGTKWDTSTDQTLGKIRDQAGRLSAINNNGMHTSTTPMTPQYKGVHYDERSELQNAHLQDLLTTIHHAKASPWQRKPWNGATARQSSVQYGGGPSSPSPSGGASRGSRAAPQEFDLFSMPSSPFSHTSQPRSTAPAAATSAAAAPHPLHQPQSPTPPMLQSPLAAATQFEGLHTPDGYVHTPPPATPTSQPPPHQHRQQPSALSAWLNLV